ncbi:MAG: metallopeptidase family protein [Thermoflexales bacterium]|nr:metallopeptidase family protein [Thermoflexales bacterium]
MVELNDFEQWVDEAIAGLPAYFRERMDNVAIAVEDWADRETLRAAGIRRPDELLGFYHGIPLTKRSSGYMLVAPDKISIYRQPILLQCRTVQQAQALTQRVVRHEVAHYFGIDDDRLRELGAY